MNFLKFKLSLKSCCSLLLAFSVSVSAAALDPVGSGISIESWLQEGGRDLPVLSFDQVPMDEDMINDIQVENVIQEDESSVRFQLSHSGPMSRQVFANVRRVEQDDGYTRSIITNIADGQQMEYLTQTSGVSPVELKDKGGAAKLLAESGYVDGQYVECPWCAPVGLFLVTEAVCLLQANSFFDQCRYTCQRRGGVRRVDTGYCGVISAECICWIEPKREASEF